MSSTIKVNNIQNLAGDDSGIDLSTNDQIILKTANTTAITVNSSQNVALASTASQSRHVEGSAQLSVADQPVLCEKLECSGPASSIDDPGDSTWPSFEIGASEAGAPSERRELIVTVGVVFAFELQGSEVCRCGGGAGMREDVCEAGVENCYQVVGAAGQISRCNWI